MEDQQSTDFNLPEEFENQGSLGKFNSWIKNHSRAITSLIIVAVIVGVGIYAYNRPQVAEETATSTEEQSKEELATATAEESNPTIEIAKPEETAAQTTETTATTTTAPAIQPVVKVDRKVEMKEDQIVVLAGTGDGVTHLAREALREYLKVDTGVTLNAEQKIFVEDYLKDRTASTRLAVGEGKNFSKETIKQAVDAAQKLNENQIKNLSKYSQMVPELS